MTLQEYEMELEALEQESDVIAVFFGSLETYRLNMIGQALSDEIALRLEGKPLDHRNLH